MSTTAIPTDDSTRESLPDDKATAVQGNDTAIPDDEIPDGGFIAYSQVFGAFLLFANSWSAYIPYKIAHPLFF